MINGVLFVGRRRRPPAFRSGQQHDEDHSPDRQQRVPNRIGNGVAEPRYLALGAVIDHAERGGRCAGSGAASQHNRVVEAEQVFSDVHGENERHGRNQDPPEEQTETELLQPRNKPRTGGDADDRDEYIKAD